MFLLRKQHIDPDEFLQRENNNFDFIRLIGACAVIFSHTYAIAWADFAAEPFQAFSHGKLAVGGPFLYMFFFLSGFLVSRSYLNSSSPQHFFKKRLLRLMPAILIMIPIVMFVIGPLFNELRPAEYFSQRHTWGFLRNISLYRLQSTLPGIFPNNPDPYIANTNLWTVALEFSWYSLTAILGVLALLRRRWALWGIFVICYGAMLWKAEWMLTVDIPILDQDLRPFVRVGIYYSAGMLAYQYRKIALKLNPILLVVFLPAWLVGVYFGLSDWVTPIFVPLFTLIFAAMKLPWTKRLTRLGDPSYGMYIWGVPLQQMVVALFGTNWFVAFFGGLGLSYLVGLASFWWVEKPALDLRNKDLLAWLRKSVKRA